MPWKTTGAADTPDGRALYTLMSTSKHAIAKFTAKVTRENDNGASEPNDACFGSTTSFRAETLGTVSLRAQLNDV